MGNRGVLFLSLSLLCIARTLAVPSGFKVRRDVRDYGAKGDGRTDDTAAFIAALTDGKATVPRPGPWNNSQYGCQTLMPSIVIVPNGTYLISGTLPLTFYTQLVGSYHPRPTLRFVGSHYRCLDAGTDEGPGNGWYGNVNQNNFFHQLRNVIIDVRLCHGCIGVHWQVSQATNIVNTDIANGPEGVGIYMEDGSGGYLGDMRITGGLKGMWIGNQQFTFRNITIEDSHVGIHVIWNWVFLFMDLRFVHTHYAVLSSTSNVGSLAFVDCTAMDVFTAFGVFGRATQLYIENYHGDNVTVSLSTLYETVVVPFTDWAIARMPNGSMMDAPITPRRRAAALVDPHTGRYFGKTRPDYDHVVTLTLENGTDVTEALQQQLDAAAAAGMAAFVPYGTYLITDTVHVPKGTRLYGEAWSRFAATGATFADPSKPVPVFELGHRGDVGVLQLADLLFTTVGPAPGAVLLQWNVQGATQGDCGMWDVHFRIGGADGTLMGSNECDVSHVTSFEEPAAVNCTGVYSMLHLTPSSGNIYIENAWGWVADHDIDLGPNVNIFSARGLVSEAGHGGVWFYGTAMEHSYAFQYNFVSRGADHFAGAIQTESAYYQPMFALNASTPRTSWGPTDPSYDTTAVADQRHGYALAVSLNSGGGGGSGSISIYCSGLYSFFSHWNTSCGAMCQRVLILINTTTSNESSLDSAGGRRKVTTAAQHKTRRHHHDSGDPSIRSEEWRTASAAGFFGALLNTHGARDVLDVVADGTDTVQQLSARSLANGFCETVSILS